MPSMTITISDEAKKVLNRRAKKNLLSLREQIEDIVRRSVVNTKTGSIESVKPDDRLVEIFSRHRKGKKK